MKAIYAAIFSFLFIFSAQAATITFNAVSPAAISIHPDIKRIAIIDRTTAKNSKANVIESVLTGEGIDGDKKAIQTAMNGLAESLENNGRFSVIRSTEKIAGAAFAGQFPDALDWALVQRLCKKYNVDAIIVLEAFDSNFIITDGRKDGDTPRFFATGLAKLDMGFRIYDPVQKSIADQHFFSFTKKFQSTSGTVHEAIAGLTNRNKAIMNVSYGAGCDYALRISPSWYSISREYFKKSKKDKNLAKGARMMEANDWEAALVSLKKAVEKGHRKTRGKAAHNIAVVYEILGKLDLAKKWATTAWGEYENKVSKDYPYWINRRMKDQARVEEQMGKL